MLGLPENSETSREAVRQSEHTVADAHSPSINEMKQAGLPAEPVPPRARLAPTAKQEQLIIETLPLVRVIAKRIYKLVPDQVSFGEIYCAGVAGLVSSLQLFDPADEVGFRDFAKSQIWKTILEGLQNLVWTAEGLRRKGSPIEAAINDLVAELHRSPTEIEISQELQIDVDAYHLLLDELKGIEIGTHHSGRRNGSVEEDIINLANLHAGDPQLGFRRADLQQRLADAIRNLPKLERLVLNLSYYEGLDLREIGIVLDETESNVSRIHASAVLRLRSQLSNFGMARASQVDT
jgi:RNA polymerase sigma factor for flagellar operon FliA